MKWIMLMGIFLFCIVVVSATSNLGTFKSRECISLYQLCDNCTYVNISSVMYPDSTVESINENMTKNGVNYNYTYCNTLQDGIYIYNVCGDKDGTLTCENITFEINPTGSQKNPTFYFIILLLSAGVIVLGFFMKDAPITIFGTFGLYFLGLYILFYGIDGIKDGVTTWAFGLITLGLAFYISARSAYELIDG